MINRFILSMDDKVYSFYDALIWDESTYYWYSGECAEKKISVIIPYFKSIHDDCHSHKIFRTPESQAVFIMGGQRIETFKLKTLHFHKPMNCSNYESIILTLVSSS